MVRKTRRSKENLIWVVDEDSKTSRYCQKLLSGKFKVKYFSCLDAFYEAMKACLNGKMESLPTLILTECNFVRGDFISCYRTLFANKEKNIPFILITKNSKKVRIRNFLKNGAVDFVIKPFREPELELKVEFHTSKIRVNLPIDSGEITFSLESLSLRKGNKELAQLTAKEIQIYHIIKSKNNSLVSRTEILNQIWQGESIAPKTFDVHLFNLRKKLAAHGIEICFSPPEHYSIRGI